MNLPENKMHLIRLICEVDNASILENIKNVLEKSTVSEVAKEPATVLDPSSMPSKSLHQRALDANVAIEEGRYTDLDELEEQIQNW